MPVGRGKKNLHNMETSSDTERDAMAVTLWVPVGLYVVLYPDRKFASGTRRGSLPSTFSPAGTSSLGPCWDGRLHVARTKVIDDAFSQLDEVQVKGAYAIEDMGQGLAQDRRTVPSPFPEDTLR